MDKEIISRNFSKYAHMYDEYADIQRHAAGKLIKKLKRPAPDNILEIGCGTGNYTALLGKKYISSKIEALDISDKMLDIARKKLPEGRVKLFLCDAESTDFRKKYGLVTSNASMQWFDDLNKVLRKYRDILEADGKILFSVFGPLTFRELNLVLGKISGKKEIVPACNFIGREGIREILESNFKKVRVEEEILNRKYPCLRKLLEKIKYTGERGMGASNGMFIGPEKLKDAEELYRNTFGGIKATYQIFYCKGEK